MVQIENVSRRGFLQGVVGAGAFVLAIRFAPNAVLAENAVPETATEPLAQYAFKPSVYLAIASDGTTYIVAHRSEMGNGVRTSLPRVVADELDADWARVKVLQAIGDEKYGDQDTDGSASVVQFFTPMREAGAAARLMLLQAAAARWNVPVGECATEIHNVVHRKTGQRAGYGELASVAAKLPVPKSADLKLKPRNEWRYIGKGAAPYDIRKMVAGKAVYGQDTRMADMLYASVAHPPVLGSAVKSVDDSATLAVHGVKQTATIDLFKPPIAFQALGGVAVLADSTWAAMQGKKKLKIAWEESPHRIYSSDSYRQQLQESARKPGKLIRDIGNVDEAFVKGGRTFEAEYYAPLLAHASMEPPAALAAYRDGKVEAWVPTQNPQGARDAIAAALGLKKEDVTVNVTLLGGAFGRKSFPDYAVEAAVLSKKSGKPVKVVWSREDDIQFDTYHSVSAMYFKALLGNDGKPVAWLQRTAFPAIASTFAENAQYAGADELSLGFSDLPYTIPNLRAENSPAAAHVRIGWLRSVSNIYHAFGIHSFTDELASAAGRDPLEYSLALLGPDRIIPRESLPKDYSNYGGNYEKYPIDTARLRRVAELAAEKAGWGKKKNGNGFGMGLAVHRSFLTYAASVVQMHLNDAGRVVIDRVDTALDAGTVVNPEMVRNQFEGAAVMGVSIALFGEITATKGVIDQSNFDGFPVARMNTAPREIHIHIVESDAPPGGVGEPGLPAFAPALCNAIFAATGKRIRELPLSKAGLA